MLGLTLSVTNISAPPVVATISDIPGVQPVYPGQTTTLLYVNAVQISLEYGELGSFISKNILEVKFVSGTLISKSEIGSDMVGSTTTTAGSSGLVPAPGINDAGNYLKGDGTWSQLTSNNIGAIPESRMTAIGDLLVRGPTNSIRLPIGTHGQIFRAGTQYPVWADASSYGSSAPSPTINYLGSDFYNTSSHNLYRCVYDGTTISWKLLVSELTVASGDLSGSYPSPSVTRLWGTPIDSTFPTNGQVLSFNSSTGKWTATTAGVPSGPTGQVLIGNGLSSPPSWSANPTVSGITTSGIDITVPSHATGDMWYDGGGGTMTRLGIGSPGQVMAISGGLPSWQSPPSSGTTYYVFPMVNNVTSSSTPVVIGSITFDPTVDTGVSSLRLYIVSYVQRPSLTGNVYLINASTGLTIPGSTMTVVTTTPGGAAITRMLSSVPVSQETYQLVTYVSGGLGGSDVIQIQSAQLQARH